MGSQRFFQAKTSPSRRLGGLAKIGTYGVIGAIGTAIDFLVFLLLHHVLAAGIFYANLCGWTITLLFVYATNSVFTFDAPISATAFARFALASAASLLCSTTILFLAAGIFPALIAKMAATALTFVAGYALSNLALGRPARDAKHGSAL
jgi:putative flippase GtrA